MAVIASAMVFGQKKEVVAAYKAVEAGDNATAISKIQEAENLLNGKTYFLEPSVLEQLYYAKGLSLIKSGKLGEGAAQLAKINDIKKVYTGKDADKKRVYFTNKADADASGIANLKEENYTPALSANLGNVVNPFLQNSHKAAMDAYNGKKYALAAPKFREVYDLLKAAGQDNKQYLYYSAITYALDNNRPKAIEVYTDLINSGYTGIETTYSAKNKKTGQVENLDKTQWDLMKKAGAAGDYTDFKTETSKSVEPELYETAIALMLESEKYDDAIKFVDKGLKKFPTNSKLAEFKSLAYYKAGKTDEAIASMKEQVAKNPQDIDTWYNLGVLASQDPNRLTEAEGFFKKALEINPNHISSLQGMFYNVYRGDDAKTIEKAEAARKGGKMDEYNKILEERRARFKKGLPYMEKLHSLQPNDLETVTTLKGLYQTLHNDAKAAEFRAKEKALKEAQK